MDAECPLAELRSGCRVPCRLGLRTFRERDHFALHVRRSDDFRRTPSSSCSPRGRACSSTMKWALGRCRGAPKSARLGILETDPVRIVHDARGQSHALRAEVSRPLKGRARSARPLRRARVNPHRGHRVAKGQPLRTARREGAHDAACCRYACLGSAAVLAVARRCSTRASQAPASARLTSAACTSA
jgi:hypothetical protein